MISKTRKQRREISILLQSYTQLKNTKRKEHQIRKDFFFRKKSPIKEMRSKKMRERKKKLCFKSRFAQSKKKKKVTRHIHPKRVKTVRNMRNKRKQKDRKHAEKWKSRKRKRYRRRFFRGIFLFHQNIFFFKKSRYKQKEMTNQDTKRDF